MGGGVRHQANLMGNGTGLWQEVRSEANRDFCSQSQKSAKVVLVQTKECTIELGLRGQ